MFYTGVSPSEYQHSWVFYQESTPKVKIIIFSQMYLCVIEKMRFLNHIHSENKRLWEAWQCYCSIKCVYVLFMIAYTLLFFFVYFSVSSRKTLTKSKHFSLFYLWPLFTILKLPFMTLDYYLWNEIYNYC